MYFVFRINMNVVNWNMILFTKSIQIIPCIVSKYNTAYDIVITDLDVGWRFRSKGPQKTDDYFGVKPPKKDPIINKKGRELGSRAPIFRSIATQLS